MDRTAGAILRPGRDLKAFGFQWHITDRCNLRCAHCYQDSFAPLPAENLKNLKTLADRIFKSLSPARVTVNLTGGEPLLVPWLFELIDHLQSFGNLEEISLITNGTVTTPEVLDGIRRFEKIRYLKVSLESGIHEVNDYIRGAGSLAKVSDGILRYRRVTDKPVILMVTLGGYNLDSIEETVRYADFVGASGVIFERFIPLGHGRKLDRQVLSADEWSQAVESIARASRTGVDPRALAPYRAFWVWLDPKKTERLQGALCNLGDESMALMPDGTVYPCRRLPVSVGNALSEPFSRILSRLGEYRADAEAGCRALARALDSHPPGRDTGV
jgi:MoaA/NifB/PqqE/SkfB family radical SAM enzyme